MSKPAILWFVVSNLVSWAFWLAEIAVKSLIDSEWVQSWKRQSWFQVGFFPIRKKNFWDSFFQKLAILVFDRLIFFAAAGDAERVTVMTSKNWQLFTCFRFGEAPLTHTLSFTRTHALLSLSHTHKHTRTLTPHLREKGLRMLALNSNPLKLSPTVCANKTLAGRNKKQNIKCPMNNNLSKDLGLNGSSRLKESNPDFSVER